MRLVLLEPLETPGHRVLLDRKAQSEHQVLGEVRDRKEVLDLLEQQEQVETPEPVELVAL